MNLQFTCAGFNRRIKLQFNEIAAAYAGLGLVTVAGRMLGSIGNGEIRAIEPNRLNRPTNLDFDMNDA